MGLALSATPLWSQTSGDVLVTRSLRDRDVLRLHTTLDASQAGPTAVAHVTVAGTKPSPADRDLVVVLYVESYSGDSNGNTAYQVPVRLQEGQTQVNVEIPHTALQNHTVWDVGIFEDGRDIEDRRVKRTGANWINTAEQGTRVAALFSENESEATIANALETFARHINHLPSPNPTTAAIPLSIFSVAAASTDWRFYFSHPMWIISADAVKEINQRPAVAQALRTYLAAQGLLVVHSVQDAAQLAEVDRLLSLPNSDNTSGWTTEFAPQHGRLLVKSDRLPELNSDSVAEHPLLRQYCFGSVLVTAEPLAEMNSNYWQQTLTPIAGHKGIAAETDGDWFWRNLIRAVGKPPVWMFCAIVTLFGAVLGPGLLVFTARLRRRSLMIFLVPAISLLATLAIVTYGVLHEGFETHVRVTSVQAIDTASQQSFVWSRQNYFSGLPPREGLNFGPQTYARSVSAENNNSYNWDGDPRKGIDTTVTLLPERQNWAGWLRPREQQQLLIGHAAPFRELPISVQRSGSNQIEFRNVGSERLPIVLFRGERHDYYVAEQLAPAEAVEVRADSLDVLRAKVAKVMVDYRPTTPPEIGEGGSLLDFGSGSRRYATRTNNFQLDDILNAFFKQRMSDQLELPPLGFAILTTVSDQVEVPLQGSSAENLHLLLGTHAW